MKAKVQLLLLILTIAAFPRLLFSQDGIDSRELFAKAYSLYSAGNYAGARELFEKVQDPKILLADYSLHYLAMIAFNERNWDLSRQLLAQLRQRYPQSIWFPHTELQRAKIDIGEKKYSQAIAKLIALRAAKEGRSDIAEESLYLLGQAQEGLGDSTKAFSIYNDLRAVYPNSRWTATVKKEQARLRDKFPDLFGLNTIQAIADEASRLTRERDTSEAEVLYKKLLRTTDEPDLHLRWLAKLSGLYLTVRKRDEAIPILEQIARDYPDSAEAPNALYQIGQIFWNRHDNAKALGYFQQVLERYPTSGVMDRAEYAAGDIYEFFGKTQEALAHYSNLATQFPRSPVRDDAAWRLAWLHYRAGEFPEAAAAFAALASQAKDGAYRTAALYWQARTTEKLGDQESAKQLHRQIVSGGEESYYQALSIRALERLGVTVAEAKSNNPAPTPQPDPPVNQEILFHLSRARELAAMTLNQLAVLELNEVEHQSRKQVRLRPVLMQEYFRSHSYGRSLTLANQLPATFSDRNFYRYPLAFWDTIQQKAQERYLDPYLVLAVIRQESLFDARARSPAAALGLMQLIPSTAARVAKQIGLTPPSNEKLYDPDINLTLGTQYLKDLLQRYSNNWFKAIAAYNAGEAAVDRWEKEIITDDIEEFVERIPYLETRGYVKLVIRNLQIYKRLYDSQK